ncbi:MAG TPA: hypothetical protein VMB84_19345 [Stellaceae bacterium]|nr:hypothetical protein [Stellaceae bacterium]
MKAQNQANGVIESGQEAAQAAIEAGDRLKETAGDVLNRASDMAGKAQDYAREAGRQAGAMAQSMYGQGNEALDMVEGFVRDNVWTGLLIAGAIGYGLACLVKTTTR